MKPVLIYCYDAYCGWCYGFSPVIKKIAAQYKDIVEIEVLSGGMMIGDQVMPIEKIGPYIQNAYQRVEELTGVKFGEDFLWHTANPDKSDWILNSEKPAIALCILKDFDINSQLAFAADLQYALNFEGRDLDDDEAYRHLLDKYHIPADEFYSKLKSEEYKEKAHYEFALCKQLQVEGFPQVVLQTDETKFYLLSKGYTDYETLNNRIQSILAEIATPL
ncbi:MAG: DsbA family protein [Chitinophagaceae bacterium]